MILLGGRALRHFLVSIKSLTFQHFTGNPNATPIHLHILVDKPTQLSLIVILETWRLKGISYSFYRAENYQVSLSFNAFA